MEQELLSMYNSEYYSRNRGESAPLSLLTTTALAERNAQTAQTAQTSVPEKWDWTKIFSTVTDLITAGGQVYAQVKGATKTSTTPSSIQVVKQTVPDASNATPAIIPDNAVVVTPTTASTTTSSNSGLILALAIGGAILLVISLMRR